MTTTQPYTEQAAEAAAAALAKFGTASVPFLVQVLEESYPSAPAGFGKSSARLRAIKTLGQIGPDARAAVPFLLHDLTPRWWFSPAADALKRIDPEALNKVELGRKRAQESEENP